MRLSKLVPLALALPLATPFLSVGTASADGSANANLCPVVLNGSNGSGTTMVKVTGTTIQFTFAASGLAAGSHAAHIHFGADARQECPAVSDDAKPRQAPDHAVEGQNWAREAIENRLRIKVHVTPRPRSRKYRGEIRVVKPRLRCSSVQECLYGLTALATAQEALDG